MQRNGNYRREEAWGELYDQFGVERAESEAAADRRSFAEMFHERGLKGFNPAEKGDQENIAPEKKHRYPSEPQDSLDLHGQTTAAIARMIRKFIVESRQRGLVFVLIVTGKGLNSEGGISKLRPETIRTLAGLKGELLLRDFKSAEARHGGFGALYVYIK